jgi:hypothetical protein
MAALLRLVLLVPLGFVLAMAAAGLTVALGMVGVEPTGDGVPWIPLFASDGVYAASRSFRGSSRWSSPRASRSLGVLLAGARRRRRGRYLLDDYRWYVVRLQCRLLPAAGFVAGAHWLVAGRQSGDGSAVRPLVTRRRARRSIFGPLSPVSRWTGQAWPRSFTCSASLSPLRPVLARRGASDVGLAWLLRPAV